MDGVLRGVVSDLDRDHYRVAVYIYIEGAGWWTKPTAAVRTVPISADGTFVAEVATGGIDNRATIFAAAVVPKSTTPPLALGAGGFPIHAPVAIDFNERFSRTIRFAGRNWGVKEAPIGVGPSGNVFSNQPSDVFVDAGGRLHLTVNPHDGCWWATEVVLLDQLDYGTYAFQTVSDLSSLDPNVTFGAFTWDAYGDDESGADAHREINFEDSRWGNPCDPTNAQMVVQPYQIPGNLRRYVLPNLSTAPALTRYFRWLPNEVEFGVLRGSYNPLNFPPESLIDHYQYWHNPAAGHFVPTNCREQFRFNLWLNSGFAPSNGRAVEVVISDFIFLPVDCDPPTTFVTCGHSAG